MTMKAAAEFFELLGYVIQAEGYRAAQEAKFWREFAGAWWDIGNHIARKPQRAREAARNRAKSRGRWNKS